MNAYKAKNVRFRDARWRFSVNGASWDSRAKPVRRLPDLGRLLLDRLFDRRGFAAFHVLILDRLGRFGIANACPRDQRREDCIPDIHNDFDHRADPLTRKVVIRSLADIKAEIRLRLWNEKKCGVRDTVFCARTRPALGDGAKRLDCRAART